MGFREVNPLERSYGLRTFEQVADELRERGICDITKSRVEQIHNRALAKMRRAILTGQLLVGGGTKGMDHPTARRRATGVRI